MIKRPIGQDHRDDQEQSRPGGSVEEGDPRLEADGADERIGGGQRRLDREGDDDRQQRPPARPGSRRASAATARSGSAAPTVTTAITMVPFVMTP